MFGMVQPKNNKEKVPEVYGIGCLGKIISFNETLDKRFIINLSGILRFRINKELDEKKLYRTFEVDYSEFLTDLEKKEDQKIKYDKSNLLSNIKTYFRKINYPINFSELEQLNLDLLVSTVAMISPFSVEEKQKLVEMIKIDDKAKILNEIIDLLRKKDFSLLSPQEIHFLESNNEGNVFDILNDFNSNVKVSINEVFIDKTNYLNSSENCYNLLTKSSKIVASKDVNRSFGDFLIIFSS